MEVVANPTGHRVRLRWPYSVHSYHVVNAPKGTKVDGPSSLFIQQEQLSVVKS